MPLPDSKKNVGWPLLPKGLDTMTDWRTVQGSTPPSSGECWDWVLLSLPLENVKKKCKEVKIEANLSIYLSISRVKMMKMLSLSLNVFQLIC